MPYVANNHHFSRLSRRIPALQCVSFILLSSKSMVPGAGDEDSAVSGKIHVTSGYYAQNEAISISSRDIVSLRDNLSFGPLGALGDLESWCTMRRAYWDHVEGESAQTKKRRRRSNIVTRDYIVGSLDRLAHADEVVIWLGTGLAEQLVLAWMPQLLRAIGGRPEIVARRASSERTLAGAATPTIWDTERRRIAERARLRDRWTAKSLEYLDKAWTAVTASDPVSLTGFHRKGFQPVPGLSRTAACQENPLAAYPDARSGGLNRYEVRLLAVRARLWTDSGKSDRSRRWKLFSSKKLNASGATTGCSGDCRRLANPTLPHPAVVLTGERTTIRGTNAHLTPEGEQFLKAELNFVELNGIEDWVGGVHLDSRVGDVWFHKDAAILRC